MREIGLALLIMLALVAPSRAHCNGCGCGGGSGWQMKTTKSRKCIGCAELASRCGTPFTTRCVFTGYKNCKMILANCPEALKAGLCLK